MLTSFGSLISVLDMVDHNKNEDNLSYLICNIVPNRDKRERYGKKKWGIGETEKNKNEKGNYNSK